MARIDDRLVHGQVIVGCCEPLAVDRVLVCDEAVADDSLRQALFAAAAPPEITLEFVHPDAALARVQDASQERGVATMLLTRDAVTMATLVNAGAAVPKVVVGGAHDRPETTESPSGWFLTDAERAALASMLAGGVSVCFQPVPGSPALDASEVLGDPGR